VTTSTASILLQSDDGAQRQASLKQPLVEQAVSAGVTVLLGAQTDVGAVALQARRSIAGTHWVSGREVKTPVRVHVTADSQGHLIASSDETGIFGVGHDLSGAINDFREALVEHRNTLEASHPLSANLQEQLDFLQRVLRD